MALSGLRRAQRLSALASAHAPWHSSVPAVLARAVSSQAGHEATLPPSENPTRGAWGKWSAALLACATGGIASVGLYAVNSHADKPADLPTISRKEVERHKTPEQGIWVTYKDGVYDITEFINGHPGGVSKILLAAGGPLEPYWSMYAQHKQPQVYELLEGLRIGTLPEKDQLPATDAADPYSNDPRPHGSIVARSRTPFNGESPLAALDSHITPTALHFKRNHMPVPDVVPEAYELQVIDADGEAHAFTLDELRSKFPKHSVTQTLQCAGNRRSEMSAVREVNGLPWEAAIGTATWTGVRLADVLESVGAGTPGPDFQHVEFVGLDCDIAGERYAASIPIQKALSRDGDCLLAFEMNGEPIPRSHGFPLRAVVPGHVAARSVKWLEKVIVSDCESDSHWQQHDYKGFCPDEDWANLDWSKAPAIQEMPITSAILHPTPQEPIALTAKSVKVSGYALAGGGRAVVRVDVSADGGKSWSPATLKPVPKGMEPEYRKHWAWRHWEVSLPVDDSWKAGSSVELVCKAVDDSYNVQPDSFGPIYNARGVLSNAWNRVAVPVVDRKGWWPW